MLVRALRVSEALVPVDENEIAAVTPIRSAVWPWTACGSPSAQRRTSCRPLERTRDEALAGECEGGRGRALAG
jgi:hypothetical protein